MLQEIPRIGLGTRKLTGETCIQTIQDAIAIGYRHIDTAVVYGNETEIGQARTQTNIPRQELWLTTKVRIDSCKFDDCISSVHQSLQKLQTEYLDLVLIHWPCRELNYDHKQTLDALIQLQKEQKIRHIGVSNFPTKLLEEVRIYTENKIFTNQVEYHVYLDQSKVKSYCDQHNIKLECYSPLAHGHLFEDPILQDIANKHNKTASQVALKRLLEQTNTIVLPKASSYQHLQENFIDDSRHLDIQDKEKITQLPKTYRYCNFEHLKPDRD